MHKSKDELLSSHSDKFVNFYNNICSDRKVKLNEFIKKLKALNIKANHPDDGWHERKDRYFQFSYPRFNDGVNIGDMVALGDYEKFRVFIVKDIKKSFFGINKYYY